MTLNTFVNLIGCHCFGWNNSSEFRNT